MNTIMTSAVLMFALGITQANAQMVPMPSRTLGCKDIAEVQQVIRRQYRENVIGSGVTDDGAMVFQMWVNKSTNTWTLTGTNVHGKMCVIAFGKGFEFIDFFSIGEES